MGFEHYKYYSEARPSQTLEDIVTSRKAQEAIENAERTRASHLRHKARMEQFRAWVYEQDFTDEEKAEMVKASFRW